MKRWIYPWIVPLTGSFLACWAGSPEPAQPRAPEAAPPAVASPSSPAPDSVAKAKPNPSSFNATVYNAGGEELQLQTLLQGHYTVIVLGCLT